MLRIVSPVALVVVAFGLSGSAGPPPRLGPVAAACPDSAFHALDFWIGDWEAINPSGKVTGHSRIERIVDGCGVLERWDGAPAGAGGPFIGTAIHVYDVKGARWRQFWVDNRPLVVEMAASVIDGRFTYEWTAAGPQGQTTHQRYTLAPDGDGVRQTGASSTDGGKTWKPTFDLHYRRAKK